MSKKSWYSIFCLTWVCSFVFPGEIGPADEFSARLEIEVDSPGPSHVIKCVPIRARSGTARVHAPKDLQVYEHSYYLYLTHFFLQKGTFLISQACLEETKRSSSNKTRSMLQVKANPYQMSRFTSSSCVHSELATLHNSPFMWQPAAFLHPSSLPPHPFCLDRQCFCSAGQIQSTDVAIEECRKHWRAVETQGSSDFLLDVFLCSSCLVCTGPTLRPQCLAFPFPLNLHPSLLPHSLRRLHWSVVFTFPVRRCWQQLLSHAGRPVIGGWRGTSGDRLLQSTRQQEIPRKVYRRLCLAGLCSVKSSAS